MKSNEVLSDKAAFNKSCMEISTTNLIKVVCLEDFIIHVGNSLSLCGHSEYILLYSISGIGVLNAASTSLTLGTQSLLLLRNDSSYELTCKEGVLHIIQLSLRSIVMEDYASLLLKDLQPYHIPLSSTIPQSMELIQSWVTASEDICNVFRISRYLTDILTELCLSVISGSQSMPAFPSYIEEMKNMFDTDFANYHSLDQLESQFCISKYRLCREFTKHCGMPPVQYLNHVRMEAAKKLLLTTNLLIHEVGSSVGIDNTNHFINLFKKSTGCTPLAYKQSAPVNM